MASELCGDGFTNLEEFGLQTDPSDPASVPVVQATLDSATNQYIVEVAKRPFVGAKLIYEVEYSTDQRIWTVIEPGDPNWIIEFDNADAYKVRSFRPYPTVKYFVRVKLSQLQLKQAPHLFNSMKSLLFTFVLVLGVRLQAGARGRGAF